MSIETTNTLARRRAQVLGNGDYLSYDKPVYAVRGEGMTLYEHDGTELLDFFNNVPHVGHCHPHVVRAIQKQVATLNTNTRYLYDNIVEYAERVTATLPDNLDTCFFVSSGSEANDLAWRIAKSVTGHTGALIIERAYHGITDATYAISPYDISDKNELSAHVMTIPAPDDFRGAWKRDDPNRGMKFADLAGTGIDELADKGHKTAAFFMDYVLSSNGIHNPPPDYLGRVYDLVRKSGGLCVADEVQSGFGRIGDHMWGFQQDGAVPDMVTLGKPIANGIPMGVLITSREIAGAFTDSTEFFSTTGGNPVACAAAHAVMDVIDNENLIAHSAEMGQYFSAALRKLAESHSPIGDIRGTGLFIGVEIVRNRQTLEPADTETKLIVNQLRERGFLIGAEGPRDNVLKIRPPLIVQKDHIDQFINNLNDILNAT